MKVFLALEIDSHDKSEVVGIYTTMELGKEACEEREPDRAFKWETIDGCSCVYPYTRNGPVWAYCVEPHDVKGAPDGSHEVEGAVAS